MKNYIIIVFCFFSVFLFSQSKVEQLVGRVVDVKTNKGIEGVNVQLISTLAIKRTDSDGKFKFENKNGFVVGEPNYSFLIQKNGYQTIGSTNNRVVFSSGAIENLTMEKEFDNSLWVIVKDGITHEFLPNVTVNINGDIKTTNKFGKVNYNFSKFKISKIKASFIKGCYKDKIVEIDSKGEAIIELVNICNDEKTYSMYNSLQMVLNAIEGEFNYANKKGESYMLQNAFTEKGRPNVENEITESIKEANILKKPIVTLDVTLSTLLNRNLIKPTEINWKKYTFAHTINKKNVYKKGDLENKKLRSQYIFPEIIPRKIPYYWIDEYQSWIVENSKTKIDTITKIFNYSNITYEKDYVMLDYKKSKIVPMVPAIYQNLLALKKLDKRKVSFQLYHGLDFYVAFIYPNTKQYIKTDLLDVKGPINELDWKIEYKIKSVENTKHIGKTFIFFYVTPLNLLYKNSKKKVWKKKRNYFFIDEWENELVDENLPQLTKNKSFFSFDVILSSLLNYKLITVDDVKNWSFFTGTNYSNAISDLTINKEYQYPKVFSKNYYEKYGSKFFNIPKEGITNHYKEWIVENSKTRINSIYLPASKIRKVENLVTNKTLLTFSIGNEASMRYSRSSNIPSFKGIDLKKVSLQSGSYQGYKDFFYESLFFVYPESSKLTYSMEIPIKTKLEPFEAYSKNWRIELKLNKVELDVINDKNYIFCYVEPLAIHYKTYDGEWHVTRDFKIIKNIK